jgi:hypothetical protein
MKSCLGEIDEEDLLDDYSEEPEELNFDVWGKDENYTW